MTHQRISIQVYGKVQGVWFRKHVANSAQNIKVSGFVKNMPDGSVYAEAQGNQHELDRLTQACELGSPQSIVQRVVVEQLKPIEDQVGFTVNY